MEVANPIYDVVFKYLMQDHRVARLLIGRITGLQVQSLSVSPQETSVHRTPDDPDRDLPLTLLRMDFAARVQTADGGQRQVLIEIQKAKARRAGGTAARACHPSTTWPGSGCRGDRHGAIGRRGTRAARPFGRNAVCRQVSSSRYPRCVDGSKNTVSRGLRAEDVARFNAFGFLALPGLLSRAEAAALRAECKEITLAENPGWDRETAAGVHGLCEKGERHARLLDDDRVHDIPHKLLGHDFLYEGSACSWYDGDTPWHGGSGAVTWAVPHIKVALYLDDLGPDEGCLRVLPGAHRNYLRMIDDRWCDPPDYFLPVRNRNTRDDFRPWGLAPEEVPHVLLPTRPGDVLVFTEDLPHAAFGSNGLRVQVALSFLARPRTPQQIAYLHSRSGWGGPIGAPRALLESGSERRRRMAQGLVDVGLEIL